MGSIVIHLWHVYIGFYLLFIDLEYYHSIFHWILLWFLGYYRHPDWYYPHHHVIHVPIVGLRNYLKECTSLQ